MRGWPHTDSLGQREKMSHDMPRFDDGTASTQEPIRIMAEPLADEIMDAQAEEHAGSIVDVVIAGSPIGRRAA